MSDCPIKCVCDSIKRERDQLRAEVADYKACCDEPELTAVAFRTAFEANKELRAENERLKADGRTFMDRYMDMEDEVERLKEVSLEDYDALIETKQMEEANWDAMVRARDERDQLRALLDEAMTLCPGCNGSGVAMSVPHATPGTCPLCLELHTAVEALEGGTWRTYERDH